MDALGIVGAIFGLAGMIGGGIGFLSYGRAKTIIELQRNEIEARELRYNTINAEFQECSARARAAEEKAGVLEGLVTQTPSIEKLATAQAIQHQEVIGNLSKVAIELTRLTDSIIHIGEPRKPEKKGKKSNATKPA